MQYEVCIDEIHLEHVLEFKYWVCVLDISAIDEAECSRKVEIGRRVADAIRSLFNALVKCGCKNICRDLSR